MEVLAKVLLYSCIGLILCFVVYTLITSFKKTTNAKLYDIGFKLIEDNDYTVTYERVCESYFGGTYIQVLTIGHKANGRHIIQSYDKDLMDEKKIGNTNVGLTFYETKLIMRKMREKGWKSR